MSAPLPLDLRAIQETLDWHDAPPDVGEVYPTSTEHETAILQLRLMLAALRAHHQALRDMAELMEKLWPAVNWGQTFNLPVRLMNEAPIQARSVLATVTEGDHP